MHPFHTIYYSVFMGKVLFLPILFYVSYTICAPTPDQDATDASSLSGRLIIKQNLTTGVSGWSVPFAAYHRREMFSEMQKLPWICVGIVMSQI